MELTEGSRVVFVIQNIKIKKVVPRTISWVLKNNIVVHSQGICHLCKPIMVVLTGN
jgi:hypothetical protein